MLSNFAAGRIHLNEMLQSIHLENVNQELTIHYWGENMKHQHTLVHEHQFYEISYVLNGYGTYVEENNYYPLQPHTCIVTKPHTTHQHLSEEGMGLLYFGISIPHAISKDWNLDKVRSVFYLEEENDISQLWKALYLQAGESYYPKSQIKDLALLLLKTIYFRLVKTFQKGNSQMKAISSSPILNKATSHIHEHLSDTLRIASVAKVCHCSERHLTRLFNEHIGMSYSDYVKEQRMKYTANLLRTTNMKIEDIAFEAGFKSVHYFTRAFCQYMNITPAKFRKLYMQNGQGSYSNEEYKEMIRKSG